jgi:hypothetical protein
VDLGDRSVEVGERPGDDLDALVLARVGVLVGEVLGEEDVDDLVEGADAGPEGVQELPAARGLADLLGELAPGGGLGLLPLLVQAAGGQLEDVGLATASRG